MVFPITALELYARASHGRIDVVATRKVDSLYNTMFNLIQGHENHEKDADQRGKDVHLADNLVYIAKKKVGSNVTIDNSKFSLLFVGASRLILVYDDEVVLSGHGAGKQASALGGLLDASKQVIQELLGLDSE